MPMKRLKEDVARCEAALSALEGSADVGALADAWSDLLERMNRTFNHLRAAAAARGGPAKGWSDKIENARKNDDLLSYVRHARNADEHGIARITERTPGWLRIRAGELPSKIESVVLVPRGPLITGEIVFHGGSPIVEFRPDTVELVAVVDRGQVYAPPSEHLGLPIYKPTAALIGRLACAHLARVVDEAEAYLE